MKLAYSGDRVNSGLQVRLQIREEGGRILTTEQTEYTENRIAEVAVSVYFVCSVVLFFRFFSYLDARKTGDQRIQQSLTHRHGASFSARARSKAWAARIRRPSSKIGARSCNPTGR